MTEKKPTKDAKHNRIVLIIVWVLFSLIITVDLIFRPPKEITFAASGLLMVGFMFFGLFDMLRAKRRGAAIIAVICIAIYIAADFII